LSNFSTTICQSVISTELMAISRRSAVDQSARPRALGSEERTIGGSGRRSKVVDDDVLVSNRMHSLPMQGRFHVVPSAQRFGER
jgi:hypothetical protein